MLENKLPKHGNALAIYSFDQEVFNDILKTIYSNCFSKESIAEMLSLIDLYDITTNRAFVHVYTRLFFDPNTQKPAFVPGTWGTIKEKVKVLTSRGLKLRSIPVKDINEAKDKAVKHASAFYHFVEGFEHIKNKVQTTAHIAPVATHKEEDQPKTNARFETVCGIVLESTGSVLKEVFQCNDYTEDITFSKLKEDDVIDCKITEENLSQVFVNAKIGCHVPQLETVTERNLFFILARAVITEERLFLKIDNKKAFPSRVTRQSAEDFLKKLREGYLVPQGWVLVKNRKGIRLAWFSLKELINRLKNE